jgi:flagellar hook protein FlgE
MSFSAFYTGLTGLKAHASALNVIGNNLANVNTVGYKSSRTSFADMFAASGGFATNGAGIPQQVGNGASVASVQGIFSQGALQSSEVSTDLAIQGNGFFALKTQDGAQVYSRAGNFSFNADGNLVDPNGYKVQGYTTRNALGAIVATGSANDIRIPTGLTAPPLATSYFQAALNLNSAATPDDPLTLSTNEAQDFSTGVSMYDSLGAEHNLTLNFVPQGGNQWTYEVRIDKTELATPTAGLTTNYQVLQSGTVSFDSSGKLTTPAGNVTIAVPALANGAAAQSVEWRLHDSSNNPIVTGYASSSAVNDLAQDGYAMGRLQSLAVDAQGTVQGVFTNGQTLQLAKVAVASFNAPQGLFRRGENTYQESLGSGPNAMGEANTGGRGKIASKSLELSNVDITDQFTELIITERGYQSNSRVITTTDTIMQEALQLKR